MQDFPRLLQVLNQRTCKNYQEEIDLFGEKFDLSLLFNAVCKQKGPVNWHLVAKELDFYHPDNIKKEGIVKRIFKNFQLDVLLKLVRGEEIEDTEGIDTIHLNALKQPAQVVPESDEKYLQGGWQNRLSLGLKSNLPNEIDWAFQKLIKLSYQHYFYIQYLPGLFDALMSHLQGFFNSLELKTMANDFVTEVGEGLPQVDEMFFTKNDGETFERVS